MKSLRAFALLAIICGLAVVSAGSVALAGPGQEPMPKTPIKHFITLMQENHSFDNYFGTYPGADGIPPGTCMPENPDDPASPCTEPHHLGISGSEDLDHSTSTFKLQLNGGRMDGFVYALRLRNQNGPTAMGYYDDRDLPYYWNIADEFVLFDRFFQSAAGGSVKNHMYWVTGTPGSTIDRVPVGGYSDLPTIFDRLQEKGISWKFYVQNYDPLITYRSIASGPRAAQVVWVPLLNYARYIDNPDLFSHIVPMDEYFKDLANNTLPAVSYLVPSGSSEHPPGSIQAGQRFVRSLINALTRSDSWYDSAFMWTYDDWGGWYDHVVPPQVDAEGYGFRVPALLVSPYARRGHIEHTQMDFTSMLKFIEENWGLAPLAERDAKASSIAPAFDFSQPPRQPHFVAASRVQEPPPKSGGLVVYLAYSFAAVAAGTVIAAAAFGPGRLARILISLVPRPLRKDSG